jgi:hypothetical protein
MPGRSWKVISTVVLLFLATCAPKPDPAGPIETRGAVPDLRGRRVLVLPVQLRPGVSSAVTIDEELEFALGSRSDRVSWIFHSEVEELLRRSPSLEAHVRNLPVGIFLQAEVRRVGDPLYGEIRRLTTLVDADVVVIPVQITYGEDEAYHLVATMIDPVSGRVFWLSTVDSSVGSPDSPGTLASVADAFARALVPLA